MPRRFKQLLDSLPAAVARDVAKGMYAAGDLIRVEAQISITSGAVSGSKHTASSPGEAPNADTHYLANNIETVQVKPLKVEIASRAKYSANLEYGTSKMAARPFMGPAVAKKRREVSELLVKAARAAVRNHFRRS